MFAHVHNVAAQSIESVMWHKVTNNQVPKNVVDFSIFPASCQLQMMMVPSCSGCNFAEKPKKMNLFSESTQKLLFSPYTTSSVAFSQPEDQFETNYPNISAIKSVTTPISVALKRTNKSTDGKDRLKGGHPHSHRKRKTFTDHWRGQKISQMIRYTTQ